jgi:hypothetical protein
MLLVSSMRAIPVRIGQSAPANGPQDASVKVDSSERVRKIKVILVLSLLYACIACWLVYATWCDKGEDIVRRLCRLPSDNLIGKLFLGILASGFSIFGFRSTQWTDKLGERSMVLLILILLIISSLVVNGFFFWQT